MELDFSLLDSVSRLAHQHLPKVSFAVVATLLAIYGQDINRAVRGRIREFNFILRTLVFVFLCAFGYGWLTLIAAPQLTWAFRQIPNRFLPIAIAILFVILGTLAERKRKI